MPKIQQLRYVVLERLSGRRNNKIDVAQQITAPEVLQQHINYFYTNFHPLFESHPFDIKKEHGLYPSLYL